MKILNIFLVNCLIGVLAMPVAFGQSSCPQNMTAEELLKRDALHDTINFSCSAINPLNCGQ